MVRLTFMLVGITAVAGCDGRAPVRADDGSPDSENQPAVANVVAVEVDGETYSVTVRSPDTGCDQYADWWEVVRPDGTLVYRRVLQHSHVSEQPFTRSGGPVQADETVIVRAHMNPGGYGGVAYRGMNGDFEPAPDIDASFAPALEAVPPQPPPCAF